jgi:predicted metal-dependent hydrolase
MNQHAAPTPGSLGAMHVRRLNVDLSQGFARHWNGGDAYRSTVFGALSFMFPVGEQFFIDSVRYYVQDIQAQGNTQLLDDIKHFAAQEAIHRNLHAQFNKVLEGHGYDAWAERALAKMIAIFGGKTPRMDLASTAAYEHFTAVLGDGLLRYDSWTRDMPEDMRTVWTWHAAEESEHKAVAYDTYVATGGGYGVRIALYLVTTLEFFFYSTVQTIKMLRVDKMLWKWSTWRSAFQFWWGPEGVGRHFARHWLAYFKPGFHPWQHDNRELLAHWQNAHAHDYREVGVSARAATSAASLAPNPSI